MTEKQEVVQTECVETKTYDVLIEEKRAPLYGQFLKSRKLGNALTFIILIVSIVGFVLIAQTGFLQVLGWILLLGSCVGMVVFYFLSKKKFENNTKEYISFINNALNKQTFSDARFADVETTDGKLEIDDFLGNGVYNDVVRVVSRNISSGKFENVSFKFAEAALFKKAANKRQAATAAFVGKFFEAENSIKFGGNIVINISREEPVDAPNALDGRATLYSADGLSIYGDEGTDFRTIIGEEFLGKVKKIKAENHLLNCAISIWEGHTFVFMSYDDDVIALPFDKPLKAEAFNSFVDDFTKVLEVIGYLGK